MKEKTQNIIIIVLIIAVVVLLLTPIFHKWNAKRVNDIRQEYVIQDANVRVQTYEWFYDMYEQITATRKKAETVRGMPEEKGIIMVLHGMIAEYNSKARMTKTKAQWMPQDLPYQIEY